MTIRQQLFGVALAGFMFFGGGAASASPLSVDMGMPGVPCIEVQQLSHHRPIMHRPAPHFGSVHRPGRHGDFGRGSRHGGRHDFGHSGRRGDPRFAPGHVVRFPFRR